VELVIHCVTDIESRETSDAFFRVFAHRRHRWQGEGTIRGSSFFAGGVRIKNRGSSGFAGRTSAERLIGPAITGTDTLRSLGKTHADERQADGFRETATLLDSNSLRISQMELRARWPVQQWPDRQSPNVA
jgi:hypothetical protein